MTARLARQTQALDRGRIDAETRSAFIEAVLSGVDVAQPLPFHTSVLRHSWFWLELAFKSIALEWHDRARASPAGSRW
jgi:hypothetical protein